MDFLTADAAASIFDALRTELGHAVSPEWWREHSGQLFNILMIDLTLAGDNAIVVGMAASQGARRHARQGHLLGHRRRGRSAHPVLRHRPADAAGHRPDARGRPAAAVRVLEDVPADHRTAKAQSIDEIESSLASGRIKGSEVGFWSALWTIILADVSMSLDNVLAVAGAAGESTLVLVMGLAIAIILMAIASSYIAKLLQSYPWIAWIGLFIILYVALDMIYRDSHQIACAAYGVGCSETIWQGIKHRLGFGG